MNYDSYDINEISICDQNYLYHCSLFGNTAVQCIFDNCASVNVDLLSFISHHNIQQVTPSIAVSGNNQATVSLHTGCFILERLKLLAPKVYI